MPNLKTIEIELSCEDDVVIASCRNFHDIASFGSNEIEALANVKDAVACYLETEVSELDDIKFDVI